MKLTTKRNRWFFLRELFLYMIPMILIVGFIDVFYNFVRCPLHPEWSAPCNVNWILAGVYGIFLLFTITCAIISARILRKVKKQIENEFKETIDNHIRKQIFEDKTDEKVDEIKPKKIIVKKDKKSEEKHIYKKTTTKKTTTKKTLAKK